MGTVGRTWKLSEATKERQRIAARKRPPMTEAHKLALSISHKGKRRTPDANERTRKTMLSKGVNHHNYSKNPSYSAVHYWIVRRYGKASQCINCHLPDRKRYHWANTSGEYKRDISDWIELCASCHWYFDNANMEANGIMRSGKKLSEGKYKAMSEK